MGKRKDRFEKIAEIKAIAKKCDYNYITIMMVIATMGDRKFNKFHKEFLETYQNIKNGKEKEV